MSIAAQLAILALTHAPQVLADITRLTELGQQRGELTEREAAHIRTRIAHTRAMTDAHAAELQADRAAQRELDPTDTDPADNPDRYAAD
ncbi:MAG: hypothetical protein AAF750_15480 [Planctomycetota bacterium]